MVVLKERLRLRLRMGVVLMVMSIPRERGENVRRVYRRPLRL